MGFGVAVLATMVLLMAADIGVWAFASLLDPPALGRTVATVLDDPTARGHLSRRMGAQLAPAVIDLGPLPRPVRAVLGLPARPDPDALASRLAEHIDGLLASGASGDAVALAAGAFARLVDETLHGTVTDEELASRGLTVDLTPIGRLVLDRLDQSGVLDGALTPGLVAVQLIDGPAMLWVARLVRLLDTLRWLLPIAWLVAAAAILVLARYRVHAFAWLGLCGVVAGTTSLLVASGVPILVARARTVDPSEAAAVTAALDAITASLVTQSAVLAGLGLALVVAGIAGGVVVSHGSPGQDLRHGRDPGRLS